MSSYRTARAPDGFNHFGAHAVRSTTGIMTNDRRRGFVIEQLTEAQFCVLLFTVNGYRSRAWLSSKGCVGNRMETTDTARAAAPSRLFFICVHPCPSVVSTDSLSRLFSRRARAQHAQRKTASAFERLHLCRDFQHGIAHGRQAVGLVGLREQFGFHHARPVG